MGDQDSNLNKGESEDKKANKEIFSEEDKSADCSGQTNLKFSQTFISMPPPSRKENLKI